MLLLRVELSQRSMCSTVDLCVFGPVQTRLKLSYVHAILASRLPIKFGNYIFALLACTFGGEVIALSGFKWIPNVSNLSICGCCININTGPLK